MNIKKQTSDMNAKGSLLSSKSGSGRDNESVTFQNF